MTLKIVINELLTKSAVGYSVIDLMRESSHQEIQPKKFNFLCSRYLCKSNT